MLHIDGSHHQWFQDERWHDLIVILDDATRRSIMRSCAGGNDRRGDGRLRAVIEQKGFLLALFGPRSPFLVHPESGGKVDYERPTQVAAHEGTGSADDSFLLSQARGRSERNFSLAGRLPGVALARDPNPGSGQQVLSEQYIAEFNRRFMVGGAAGYGFISCGTGTWS